VKKDKICDANESKPKIRTRADFIEFENNEICITEVSGYTNKEYQEQHADKESEYASLVTKHSYIKYKIIDVADLSIKKEINKSDEYLSKVKELIDKHAIDGSWDGTQIIVKEKYEGMSWSDLEPNTLIYYATNLNGFIHKML